MSTILFPSGPYGPIHSRRLGISLGVNLLPSSQKMCSFECIYCECGFTKIVSGATIPSKQEVLTQLEEKLKQMSSEHANLDVFTFAGNGEPTMHPDFAEIIDETIKLRDKYYPSAKISVLSNATMLHKKNVVDALKRVDNNILKLDSAFESTAKLIDGPKQPNYSIARLKEQLKQFDGDFIMQTIFLRGSVDGKLVDNTTEEEVSAWLNILEELKPKSVMIYPIDRETPVQTLEKVAHDELLAIADRVKKLGIYVSVA